MNSESRKEIIPRTELKLVMPTLVQKFNFACSMEE